MIWNCLKRKAFLLFLLIPFLAVLYSSLTLDIVSLSDFFSFSIRSYNLSFSDPSEWVNGFYPFGYPLIIKLFGDFGGYFWTAKLLSFVSAGFVLTFFYKTCLLFWKNNQINWALIIVLFVACNASFIFWASVENTDMPWLACINAYIYYLIKYQSDTSIKSLIIASAFLGLGYMIRYTSLIFLPATLFCIFYWVSNKKLQKILLIVLTFLGIFLIVTFPQLFLSFKLKGSPFYNLQHWNVWFGIYYENNWDHWMEGSVYKSLREVYLLSPQKFFENYKENLNSYLTNNLCNLPVYSVTFAGLLFSFFDQKNRKAFVFLASLYISFLLALSLAFFNDRLLIFLHVLNCLYFVLPFTVLFKFINQKYKISQRSLVILFVCMCIYAIVYDADRNIRQLLELKEKAYFYNEITIISNLLNKNGLKENKEVLRFSKIMFYDKNAGYLKYFSEGNEFFNPYGISNIDDILYFNKDVRFLIVDKKTVAGMPWISPDWNSPPVTNNFNLIYSDSVIKVLKIIELN